MDKIDEAIKNFVLTVNSNSAAAAALAGKPANAQEAIKFLIEYRKIISVYEKNSTALTDTIKSCLENLKIESKTNFHNEEELKKKNNELLEKISSMGSIHRASLNDEEVKKMKKDLNEALEKIKEFDEITEERDALIKENNNLLHTLDNMVFRFAEERHDLEAKLADKTSALAAALKKDNSSLLNSENELRRHIYELNEENRLLREKLLQIIPPEKIEEKINEKCTISILNETIETIQTENSFLQKENLSLLSQKEELMNKINDLESKLKGISLGNKKPAGVLSEEKKTCQIKVRHAATQVHDPALDIVLKEMNHLKHELALTKDQLVKYKTQLEAPIDTADSKEELIMEVGELKALLRKKTFLISRLTREIESIKSQLPLKDFESAYIEAQKAVACSELGKKTLEQRIIYLERQLNLNKNISNVPDLINIEKTSFNDTSSFKRDLILSLDKDINNFDAKTLEEYSDLRNALAELEKQLAYNLKFISYWNSEVDKDNFVFSMLEEATQRKISIEKKIFNLFQHLEQLKNTFLLNRKQMLVKEVDSFIS